MGHILSMALRPRPAAQSNSSYLSPPSFKPGKPKQKKQKLPKCLCTNKPGHRWLSLDLHSSCLLLEARSQLAPTLDTPEPSKPNAQPTWRRVAITMPTTQHTFPQGWQRSASGLDPSLQSQPCGQEGWRPRWNCGSAAAAEAWGLSQQVRHPSQHRVRKCERQRVAHRLQAGRLQKLEWHSGV